MALFAPHLNKGEAWHIELPSGDFKDLGVVDFQDLGLLKTRQKWARLCLLRLLKLLI